jgi:hypothetical protein
MMDLTKEQPMCMNFCTNLGKIAPETLAMIRQAFGEESMEGSNSPRLQKRETGEEQSQEHAHLSL